MVARKRPTHFDLDMLELQHNNLLAYPDRKLRMLNIDSGGVQARKVIDRMLAEEPAAATARA